MTPDREQIIRMAREAWLTDVGAELLDGDQEVYIDFEALERFTTLVAAAEREAMLDLVDNYAKNNTDLREAIRARGNT